MEVDRFLEVYNAAWEELGRRAVDRGRFATYAKDLKPILDENWAFIAERQTRARSWARR